jgi:hypothetical protein
LVSLKEKEFSAARMSQIEKKKRDGDIYLYSRQTGRRGIAQPKIWRN